MHWRRWLSALAVLGVLLHAAAVVRHNGVMLAATSGAPATSTLTATLAADLGVICHAAGGLSKAAEPTGSGSGGTEYCPICAGLASVHTLPAVELPAIAMPYGEHVVTAAAADQRLSVQRRLRPPSRAPPAVA